MALNFDALGATSDPIERSWGYRDSLLYALRVGAGATDPTGFELEFITENSTATPQRVLPTFATMIGQGALRADLGDIDMTKLVHGDQAIVLHAEIPPSGTVACTSTLAGIYDKGSGALVVLQSESVDAATGRPAFTTRTGLFIREAGGFGGPRGPEDDDAAALASQPVPPRPPDDVVRYPTRRDQALLYRLNGDANPLHSDPAFAKRAGFDRPILHGLCTYGFTGRALLHALCGSDPARFASMRARFSRPTMPGDELSVSMWDVGADLAGAYRFRTETQSGDVVIDAGLVVVAD